MGLSKKTFYYSVFISFLLMAFVVIYFTWMLPSLYVDYMAGDDLDSVTRVQEHYMETGDYSGVTVKNLTGPMTIEIPISGNQFYIAWKYFKMSVTAKEPEIAELLQQFQDAIANADSIEDIEFPKVDMEAFGKKLLPDGLTSAAYPLSVNLLTQNKNMEFQEKPVKLHTPSKSVIVFEGGVVDGDNEYTSYIAAGKTQNSLVISFLPVMTPQMKEIKSIVFGSLPMIMAVVFLLVLVSSQVFSGKIVNPVIRLSMYAQELTLSERMDLSPLPIKETDEIGTLGTAVNELYERLCMKYRELEEKNVMLRKENQRQEVFLRASSHQLKTPIAAALLLADGMIQEIGKYKNTKESLPVLKKQLLSMKIIVEDILYLNHCADHIEAEPIEMGILTDDIIKGYEIQTDKKRLKFSVEGIPPVINADKKILKKILDNLISNAVSYTPEGREVSVSFREDEIRIYNAGGHIEEQLLPHIYDPFVSSDTEEKGRGLGLYLASYYAGVLGFRVSADNEGDGVLARLLFLNN